MTLCAPIIGWRTLTRSFAPTASSGDPVGLQNGLTYNAWVPESMPATLEWQLGEEADYVAVAGDGLGGVALETSPNGSAWTSQGSLLGGDIRLLTFDAPTHTYFRLTFTGTAPRVFSVYIGERLQMYRSLAGGHSPVLLSRSDSTRPRLTGSPGVWTGRQVQRRGYSASLQFNAVPEQWYRDNFQPYVVSSRAYPFFIVERPLDYPTEVAYCFGTSSVRPSHRDVSSLLNVKVEADGFRSS